MPQTLQCPKCSKALSVGDQSAGKRVKCPHCSKDFLAPGFAASSNDDDDWLQLDSDPVQAPASPPASEPDEVVDIVEVVDDVSPRPSKNSGKSPIKTPSSELPSLEDAEIGDLGPPPPKKSSAAAAGLDMFGASLDEFTSSVEPLPSKAPAKTDDVFGDLPPVEPSEVVGSAPAAESIPTVEAVEFQQEFRVTCHICNSILYAKAKQQGRKIKCHDCHTEIVVPAPPKVKKKTKIDIDRAATFSFEESKVVTKEKKPDPYRKSAQELLDEAAKVETTEPKPDYDAPDVKEWARNTFGVFLDPGVILHWAGITLLAAIPTAIVLWTESELLLVGLFVGGLVLSAVVAACGLAILQAVANEHKMVTEWPTGDPVAWFDDLVFVLAAAGLVGVPVWALTMLTFGPSLIAIAVTMFAIYALFPFVLLSMLDMRSILVPFSPEVARSATRCQDAWGVLYLTSGLLFFGLFLLFAMLSAAERPIVMAVCGIAASVAVAFCYFGLIGQLAYAIGQAINEPPKKRASVEE